MAASIASSVGKVAGAAASSIGNVAGAAAKAIGSNFSALAQDTATAAFPFLKGMSSFMKTEQTSTDYNKASDTVSNEGGFKLLDDSLSDIHQAIKMGNELLGGVREDVGEIRKLLQNFGGKGSLGGEGKPNDNNPSLIDKIEKIIIGGIETAEVLSLLSRLGLGGVLSVGGAAVALAGAAGFASYADRQTEDKKLEESRKRYSDTDLAKWRANANYDNKNKQIQTDIDNKNQDLAHFKELESRTHLPEKKADLSKKEVELQDEINKLLEDQKTLLENRNKTIAELDAHGIPVTSGAGSTGSPRIVGSTYRQGNFGGAKFDSRPADHSSTGPNAGVGHVIRRLGGNSSSTSSNSTDQTPFPNQSAADFIKSRGLNPNDFIHTPGILNNNIGNLKYKNIGWVGEVGPSKNLDEGSPQSVFSSPDDGMRAGMLNILNMYKGGKHTIEEIAAAYSPSNVEGAIKNFSQFTGYKKNEDLRLTDKDRLIHFFKGVAKQEQGDNSKLYGDDMYERGAERALGLGKYGSASSDGTATGSGPKNKEEVLNHIDSMRKRGWISNPECVTLAMAAVGVPYGGSKDGSHTSDWIRGDAIVGASKSNAPAAGTPIATFLDGLGNVKQSSNRYAGGTGGTPGIDRDHAGVLTGNYKYDKDGNVIAAEITDQSRRHPWEGQTHWISDTGPVGTGGEMNLRNYNNINTKHGLLGGNLNPEKIRRDNLTRQKQTSSGPDYDKGLHDYSATYGGPMTGRDAYGRNNTAFPVPNDIPRMSRDMFMNQGDNTDLKNPLTSKGILPDKKDPLDTLLDQYQAHDNAKFKNMVGRKTDLAEFTKYDLYSNMKGRTSGPSTTNNIYGNHDNKENPLTPHKKKGNIPPVAPPDHVIHKLWTVKAPNGAYSGGGIGHM